jgi:hypothetical protein
VVTFAPREVAGAPTPSADAHGHAPAPAPATGAEADKRASTHSAFIEQLKVNQGLPRWRIADLPATHQQVYYDLYKKSDGTLGFDDFSKTFMNAPTHCSTCHQ